MTAVEYHYLSKNLMDNGVFFLSTRASLRQILTNISRGVCPRLHHQTTCEDIERQNEEFPAARRPSANSGLRGARRSLEDGCPAVEASEGIFQPLGAAMNAPGTARYSNGKQRFDRSVPHHKQALLAIMSIWMSDMVFCLVQIYVNAYGLAKPGSISKCVSGFRLHVCMHTYFLPVRLIFTSYLRVSNAFLVNLNTITLSSHI